MGKPITIVDNDEHLGYSVGNVKSDYIMTQATNDFMARVNMVTQKSHTSNLYHLISCTNYLRHTVCLCMGVHSGTTPINQYANSM